MTRFLGRAITSEITSHIFWGIQFNFTLLLELLAQKGDVRHDVFLSNSALYCIFTVVKFIFQRKIQINVQEFSVVRPEYQWGKNSVNYGTYPVDRLFFFLMIPDIYLDSNDVNILSLKVNLYPDRHYYLMSTPPSMVQHSSPQAVCPWGIKVLVRTPTAKEQTYLKKQKGTWPHRSGPRCGPGFREILGPFRDFISLDFPGIRKQLFDFDYCFIVVQTLLNRL
jgi:hypothetical protein